jgi:hypothetical protein
MIFSIVYLVGTVTSHSELNVLFTGCNIGFPLPGNLRIFFMGIYVIIKVIKVVKFLNFLVISMFDLTVCYCFFTVLVFVQKIYIVIIEGYV